MKYLIKVKDGRNGYRFEFPEFDSDVSVAKDKSSKKADIKDLASSAFCGLLNEFRRQRKPIPLPSMNGDVSIPIVLELKIKLWNWMLHNHFRAVDITERTGLSPQKTARIMNFEYQSDIDRVIEACDALGAEVSIDVK